MPTTELVASTSATIAENWRLACATVNVSTVITLDVEMRKLSPQSSRA